MTLLLPDRLLDHRRQAAASGLAPLVASLRADLAPLLDMPPEIPREKARLTRAGGVCSRDGTRLTFDPYSPEVHRCPRCGGREEGVEHYGAWLMWQHLWLAERAVQGALLHLLVGGAREQALATGLLEQYVEQYLENPNQDNALGPARMFFSTYLESIWLLQVCIAADLLEAAGQTGGLAGSIRDRVVEPAVRLIRSFDEGGSNRQVWNNAAMLAAGGLLRNAALVDRAIEGRSGLIANLSHGLLSDGSWYEGENYHVFAHRGLWYGLTMAECANAAIPSALSERFDEGFVTPWLTALPDMTLPSRRDSPHAVSLRQWRFAELAELGLARRDDDRLRGALATLYQPDVQRGDTGRSRSAADIERNEPASNLTRADLGWRALLHALPTLGDLQPVPPRSALLAEQGIGVLRGRGGQLYAALDYGHSGGGHGHPDRLNVILCDGPTRWLDDPGTGSYVDPTLHWYRSTLAHNAPLADGRSQARVHGTLTAYEEQGDTGWIEATVNEIAPGVRATRSIIAMGDYVVDVITWTASTVVRIDLPLHAEGETLEAMSFVPGTLGEASGLEDGFDFVRDARHARFAEGPSGSLASAVRLAAARDGANATVHVFADPPVEWWRAVAPGPPGRGKRTFHLARSTGVRGRLTMLWDLCGAIESCRVEARGGTALAARVPATAAPAAATNAQPQQAATGARTLSAATNVRTLPAATDAQPLPGATQVSELPPGAVIVRRKDGIVHTHSRTPTGWQILLGDNSARIELRGLVPAPVTGRAPDSQHAAVPTDPSLAHGLLGPAPRAIGGSPLVFELAEAHYRRSEPTWTEAGEPRATVALSHTPEHLVIEVVVQTPEPVFVPAHAVNTLDNEHPDINGAGVQLHLRVPPAAFNTLGAAAMSADSPASRDCRDAAEPPIEQRGSPAAGYDDPAFVTAGYVAAWMAVPEPGRGVRVRETVGSQAGWQPAAEWQRTASGYTLRLALPRSALPGGGRRTFSLDVLVNESAPGRTRRRGQLVLSGARGEWIYLRGDRHPPARYLPFILDDA